MVITQELKNLAKLVVAKKPSANFSFADNREALRNELAGITKSIATWNRNKYDVFELMQESFDSILPERVIDRFGDFADISFIGQGQRKTYKKRVGKNRAKQFITRVGLSGVYESFRLDWETFEVTADAIGGTASIDWERLLDGQENLDDYFDLIMEGMEDAMFVRIQAALRAAITSMPAANHYTNSTFDAAEMRKLVATVSAYGRPVIFAPPEFVSEMSPSMLSAANANPNVDTRDIADVRDTGYIGMFFGAPVIRLPQGFIDDDNTSKVVDTQTAYIFPSGDQKVVQIVFEGDTQIDDFKNRDRSMEIEAYRKFGVMIMHYNNWAMYRNTGIPQEADLTFGYPGI